MTIRERVDTARRNHPGMLLIFRMGDFYEAFDDDAVQLSVLLELTITSRKATDGAIKMTGFPYHQLHKYMATLREKGASPIAIDANGEIEDA